MKSELLQKIVEEIESVGAWFGHMSAIDYLEEYYEPFLKILQSESIPCEDFISLHKETQEAKEKVNNWLEPEDTEQFEELDLKYYDAFVELLSEVA